MRCKNHYSDLSSTVGVCASCLRHRLHSLIAAEQQIQSQIQYSDGKHRNFEKNPAVSSQFNSRKFDRSDDTRRNDHHLHRVHPPAVHAQRHRRSLSDQLFDRTPEVRVPTTNSKKKRSFFRLLSFNIFRSRNRKSTDTVTVTVTDPRASDSSVRESRGGNNATSSSSSSSWFSTVISASRNRHRRKHTLCTGESATTAGDGPVRRQHCGGRGMSPARNSDVVTGDVETESQNATESLKHTPRRTPVVRRGGSGGHVRNISGLSFCLSPLVRASPNPNLQWNHKGLPPDVVLPADGGAPAKPHLSYAKSFCANRSRKLVDYGRLNPNR